MKSIFTLLILLTTKIILFFIKIRGRPVRQVMNRDNLSVVGGNNETLIVNLFIFFYWARWLCALLERLCVQVCACVFNTMIWTQWLTKGMEQKRVCYRLLMLSRLLHIYLKYCLFHRCYKHLWHGEHLIEFWLTVDRFETHQFFMELTDGGIRSMLIKVSR